MKTKVVIVYNYIKMSINIYLLNNYILHIICQRYQFHIIFNYDFEILKNINYKFYNTNYIYIES